MYHFENLGILCLSGLKKSKYIDYITLLIPFQTAFINSRKKEAFHENIHYEVLNHASQVADISVKINI